MKKSKPITYQLICNMDGSFFNKFQFSDNWWNRRERITASGGEVGRLNTGGGTEVRFFSLLIEAASLSIKTWFLIKDFLILWILWFYVDWSIKMLAWWLVSFTIHW